MLRSILLAAVIGGLVGGLLVTVIQTFGVVPLILEAEVHEQAVAPEPQAIQADGHDHDHGAWAPQDGIERVVATAFSNLLAGIGFALLLAAAFAVTGGADWYRGLVWGLGGYAAFVLAPSLGLPPDMPGMDSAPLAARQTWWLLTVVATAGGLFLLFRFRQWWGVLGGAALLVLPHVIGAPVGPGETGPVPESLVRAYASATHIANFLFWAVLGAATGYLFNRFARPVTAQA